jgi:quinol monooxygenase YgiN
MIACGLRIHVLPSKHDEVYRLFRGLLEQARVRGGCLACGVYQDLEDPAVLALVQEWASWDDLERYLRSEDYRKLLVVMEVSTHRPEVWFDTIATREGLERVAVVLGASEESA